MNRMALAAYDILLVDDETELLFITRELLQVHGFSVLTAHNGGTALAHLDQKQVGLIVLDLDLAGEDGLGLMDYFKSRHPQVPIVLYTGLIHDPRQVASMLQRGAASYVNKAQPIEALVAAIKEVRARRMAGS